MHQAASDERRERERERGLSALDDWLSKGTHQRRLSGTLESDYALAPRPTDAAGKEGVLGSGAFGVVRRFVRRDDSRACPASVPGGGQPLAVKAMERRLVASSKRSARRVMVELEVLRHVRHDNVVRLHEVCYGDTHVYMVMEACEGVELFTMLQKGPMQPSNARLVLKQLLRALECLHGRSVVHRDVKPENILVDPATHHTTLVDFGIAKYHGPHGQEGSIGFGLPPPSPSSPPPSPPRSPMVATTPGVGTPLYMALESLSSMLDDSGDGRCARWMSSQKHLPKLDVYSAGVTAYVMLVGKLPYLAPRFEDKKRRAAHLVHHQKKGFPVHRNHSSLPLEALECVRDLMSPDVRDRPGASEALSLDWLVNVRVPARAAAATATAGAAAEGARSTVEPGVAAAVSRVVKIEDDSSRPRHCVFSFAQAPSLKKGKRNGGSAAAAPAPTAQMSPLTPLPPPQEGGGGSGGDGAQPLQVQVQPPPRAPIAFVDGVETGTAVTDAAAFVSEWDRCLEGAHLAMEEEDEEDEDDVARTPPPRR